MKSYASNRSDAELAAAGGASEIVSGPVE